MGVVSPPEKYKQAENKYVGNRVSWEKRDTHDPEQTYMFILCHLSAVARGSVEGG